MYTGMNTIPMIQPQIAWSFIPCTVNQEATGWRQACMLNVPSIVVPAPALPTQSRASSEDSPVCNRTTYLRRSIYRLVYESIYLALTDPKLLGWYLGLSPEDRKIIQDKGGLHQFLKRHPALELSKYHVYVKKLQENLPQSGNCYNQHHTAYCSPVPQRVQELSRLTLQMANAGGCYNVLNPEPLANFSLDIELEKRTQEVNSQSANVLVNGAHNNSNNIMLQGSGSNNSLNEDTDAFYSVIEEDKSIVLCVPKEDPTGFPSSSCLIDKSPMRSTMDRSTSPMRQAQTRDVMVGTEQISTWSAPAQTEQPQTADKHFNTELYMLDLDYLTEEFITMKTERDELREKVKMQRIKSPFARIVNNLQKLETDYNNLREKILAGISLQDLRPLSVDSDEPTSDSLDAKISGDMKTASPGSSQRQYNTPSPPSSPSETSEDTQAPGESPKVGDITQKDTTKTNRAVTRVSKDRELSPSEAWYDAEEDLPSVVSEVQQVNAKQMAKDEMTNDEKKEQKIVSAYLFVSGLPKNVTESDVMLWFQKYHVSEVHISTFKHLRVAIVIVGSTQLAEAAVKELKGLRITGHSLQVERISSGQKSEGQGQASIVTTDHTDPPEGLKHSNKNQLPTSTNSSSTKKKVVCVSPTAQGTFVPQHYGTMGSFDILMSELMQRHPAVGRQKIVDALLELRAKYRGVLSGLPLRTIREMTSELLTRPEAALNI